MKYVSRLSFLVLLLASAVFAENPQPREKFGRLPDGKAFRVDDSGYQLVDQIAELEVENDSLKRKVVELEDRLSNGSNSNAPRVEQIKPILPPTEEACATRTEPLRLEVSRLTAELQSVKQASLVNSTNEHELRVQVGSLNAELDNLRLQLRQAPTVQQIQSKEEQSRSLSTTVSQLKDDLKKKDAELLALRQELSSANQTLEQASAGFEQELKFAREQAAISARDLAAARESEESLRQAAVRASASAKQDLEKSAKVQEIERASLAPQEARSETAVNKNIEEVDTAISRNKLNSRLATIQNLIMERKNLFDSAASKRSGVSINLQPLRTKSGASLDTIRSQIRSASDESDLASLSAGVSEIEKILKDDIQVIKRLAHL